MNLRHIEGLRLGRVYTSDSLSDLISPHPCSSSFPFVVLSLFPLFPNAATGLIVFLAWWNLFRAKFPGEEKRREGEGEGRGGSVTSLDVRWQHCRSRSDIFRIEKRRYLSKFGEWSWNVLNKYFWFVNNDFII